MVLGKPEEAVIIGRAGGKELWGRSQQSKHFSWSPSPDRSNESSSDFSLQPCFPGVTPVSRRSRARTLAAVRTAVCTREGAFGELSVWGTLRGPPVSGEEAAGRAPRTSSQDASSPEGAGSFLQALHSLLFLLERWESQCVFSYCIDKKKSQARRK